MTAVVLDGLRHCSQFLWELSVLDAGTMLLVLVLLMLNAAQFLPEPQLSQGRISILVALFLTMTALFSWFAVLVARSVCARGIFGEFGKRC